MGSFVLEEVGVDQSHNLSAQRLVVFMDACVEDLEPDLEIRVTNENGRVLFVTVPRAAQEPTLLRIWIFDLKTCIEALDKIPGKTIVDPRAIVFAKDDPGLASRIPNDVLPISSGTSDEEGPL